MASQQIVIYVNGRRVVPTLHPTDTLAELLHHIGLRGTKVVCEQGGCGACSVILTYWDPRENIFRHKTVNACLVPIVYADHTAILTVEGIGSTTNPHPIQRLIAENNGSQCGYCTPGFVVSMYGKLLNKDADESMIHTLASNLCRCTGYRPIAETAKMIESMGLNVEYPYPLPDELKACDFDYLFDGSSPSHPPFVDRAHLVTSTTSLKKALAMLKEKPALKPICGFSEILVIRSDHNARGKETDASQYILTWRIQDLIHIIEKEDGVHIGASTTINQIRQTIKRTPSLLKNPRMVELTRIYSRFASPQVRNCATIGGNVCHGSPVSDSLPFLLASEAVFVIVSLASDERSSDESSVQLKFRCVKADEWMKGYLRNSLLPGELLYEVIIPRSTETSMESLSLNASGGIVQTALSSDRFFTRSYKLSRRYDDDIAVVGGCLEISMSKHNNGLVINRFRVAYSAMSTTVIRSKVLEEMLEKTHNVVSTNPSQFKALITAVREAVSSQFALNRNVPGGMAMFRSIMAQDIIVKFLLEALNDFGFKFDDESTSSLVGEASYHCVPEGIEEYGQYYEGKCEFDETQKIQEMEFKEKKESLKIVRSESMAEKDIETQFEELNSMSKKFKNENNSNSFGRSVVHQSALQQATGEANYLSTMKEVINDNIDNNILNEDVNNAKFNSVNSNSCLYMCPIYAATIYGKVMNIEEVKSHYNNRYSCHNPRYKNSGYLRILTAKDIPNYDNPIINTNVSTQKTSQGNPGVNRVGVSGLRDEPVLMTNGDDILAPSQMIAVVVCETMRAAKKIAADIRVNAILARTDKELQDLIAKNSGSECEINTRLIIDVSGYSSDKAQGNIVTNISDYISLLEESEGMSTSPSGHCCTEQYQANRASMKRHLLATKDLFYSEGNRFRDYVGTEMKLADTKAQGRTSSSTADDSFAKLFEVTGMKVFQESDRVYKSANGPRTHDCYNIYYSDPKTSVCGMGEGSDPYCIIESNLDLQHQEHFYFETHSTLASVDNAHILNTSVADDMNEREISDMKLSPKVVEEPKVTISLTTTTQNISGVVNNVAAALSIPTSRISVNICNNRIGGGFGGKESTFQQQTACALASLRSNSDGSVFESGTPASYQYRPVYSQSSRTDDLKYSGKRHPFSFRNLMRVNLKTMKIEALQIVMFSDAGYCMDLSGSVMERAVFHAANSYYVPNIKIVGYVVKTRSNSNTAFRGFGAPQAVLNIEMLVERAEKFKRWFWAKTTTDCHDEVTGPLSLNLRTVNLLRNGDVLPYGGAVFGVTLQRMLNTPLANNNHKYSPEICLDTEDDGDEQPGSKRTPSEQMKPIIETPFPMKYMKDSAKLYNDKNSLSKQFSEMRHSYSQFNKTHKLTKRGVGMVPLTFGITFTQRFLNQCSAIVTLHKDGSFSISHCGIEMGQGIDTKMRQLAAQELSCSYSTVTIQQSSSSLLPNGPPTSASSAADLNGYAIINAIKLLKEELSPIIDEVGRDGDKFGLINWPKVAFAAFMRRAQMSFIGHYSSSCKGYDFVSHQGTPFAYYSFSSALVGVEVDVMTGEYKCLRAAVCVDVGSSLNHGLDIGQIEGAFIQGLGYINEDFIMLDVIRRDTGERIDRIPLSGGPGNYKIPSILDIPESFSVALLAGSRNPKAPHSSKGVGEPPLCLGAALMVALQDAVDSCYEGQEVGAPQLMHPCTVESVKNALPRVEEMVGL